VPYKDKERQLEAQRHIDRRRYAAQKERRDALNRVRRERLRVQLLDYLATHPCVDCGERDIVVLQFDHARGEKSIHVMMAASRGWSWERTLTEIAKCDVRCANCHVRITAKRAGWKRLTHGPVAETD
jgi:hypothetical protein